MGGINTNLSADGIAGSHLLENEVRVAGHLESSYSGKLVRVNLTDFSVTGVEVRGVRKETGAIGNGNMFMR